MAENNGSEGRYASAPCMAGEIAPDYFDPLGVDSEQACDVARWRRAERVRLRAERPALCVEVRGAVGAALSGHLRDLLADQFGDMRERVFSAYWPIKGEPDLRPLMADLHATVVRVALPLVEVKQAPLVFRRWTPETYMVRGDWNIPVPPPQAEVVTPEVMLAPLVGWDRDGYRLGYGGGYFDRRRIKGVVAPVLLRIRPPSRRRNLSARRQSIAPKRGDPFRQSIRITLDHRWTPRGQVTHRERRWP